MGAAAGFIGVDTARSHGINIPQKLFKRLLINRCPPSFLCRSIALEFVLQSATDQEEAEVKDRLHEPSDL